MENEKTAIQFQTMDFDEQSKIINATLTNCAKLINEKQLFTVMEKGENNGMVYKESKASFADAVRFRFANADELFNMAYINCFDMLTDERYNDMPIALFVSKASGKAINSLFYQNGKRLALLDYETELNCADCFDDYSIVFDMDRIESILEYVRTDIKVNCAKVIDLLVIGYNFKEIADIMDINIKTVYKYASAIANAVAMVNCADAEFSKLESIIASDILKKDKIAYQSLEDAIYKAYKAYYPKAEKTDAKTMVERLKAACYMQYDAKQLASLFYSK